MEKDISKLKIEKPAGIIRHRRRRRYVYWLAALIILAGAAFGLLTFYSSSNVKAGTVSMMYPYQELTLLNASGYVVAQRKAAVASKTTGRLVWIGVEEGSHVKGGQVIARLENEDVAASRDEARAKLNASEENLNQAKAELDDAAVNFKRDKELLDAGIVSKTDFDASLARYKKAVAGVDAAEATVRAGRAALKSAEVAYEYTLIRAPFDSVVLTKNADIGDIITPLGAAANAKAAVVTIADMSSLQVEVDVSESNIEKIKISQPCVIQLDALPDTQFKGQVHMIVPTADRSKASVLVKVRFLEKDPRVLPEMSAKAAFISRPLKEDELKPRTVVEKSAVVAKDSSKFVFVIKDGTAEEAQVKLGDKIGDSFEVLSGVRAGEQVVLSPPHNLKSGSRVRILE